MASVLAPIASWIMHVISDSGYLGVALLMAIESACIPLPSEVIMPFSGFLVFSGRFEFLPLIFFGALGNLTGSIIAYFAGIFGGRKFLEKYGKYVLLKKEELDKSEIFFKKYGSASVFFARLLPVVRTFISLPAGIAKMPFWKFSVYSFSGALIWSAFLAYIGLTLGKNWQNIEGYFRNFDWLVLAIILIGVGYFIYRKIRSKK